MSGLVMMQFGGPQAVQTISNMSVHSQGAQGGTSSGTINLQPDGTVAHSGSGTVTAGRYTGPAAWCNPANSTNAALFDFICDSVSSSIPGTGVTDPPIGTWTNMSVQIPFSLTNSGNRGPDRTWNCRIRDHASGTVLNSFTVTITLENT